MTDDQLERAVLAALAARSDSKAWDALTYEAGPYSINKVRYWVAPIVRSVIERVQAAEPATPSCAARPASARGFTGAGSPPAA
jgi:hypothetical protein